MIDGECYAVYEKHSGQLQNPVKYDDYGEDEKGLVDAAVSLLNKGMLNFQKLVFSEAVEFWVEKGEKRSSKRDLASNGADVPTGIEAEDALLQLGRETQS